MNNFIKNWKERKHGLSFFLNLAASVCYLAALLLYLLGGVSEFTPTLSQKVIVLLSLCLAGSLLLLLLENKLGRYLLAMLGLWTLLEYIVTEVNYFANLIAAIDGSAISVTVVLTIVIGVLGFLLMLISAILQKEKIVYARLFRRLAVSFLSLVIVFGVVYEAAEANASVINNALGTTSYATVDNGDEESDSDYFPSDYDSTEEVAAYAKEVCEEAEAEGLVLLKNENNALPLSSGDSVSCVLQTSVNLNYGATGSGKIDADKYDDLKTALEDVGLEVNETLWNFYETDENATSTTYETAQTYDRKARAMVYKVNALPWELYTDEAKDSIAETGGTAIVVIGRLSGEGSDISATGSDGIDGSYLSISEEEQEILQELTTMKQNGEIDKIVVLLNTALAFQTAFLDGSDETIDVDACMWIGNTGITGIHAVADALVGNVTPSGKLSDTYVKDNFASPAMASWILNDTGTFSSSYTDYEELGLNSTQQYYGVYVEGIYVGYRYYETRYEDVVLGTDNVGEYDYSSVVAYSFGYGLSYTTFEYSDYSVTETEDGDYEVTVTVTNTGDTYSGKEVVQVYLQKPYTDYDVSTGVEKASVELVGFEKTSLLAPGESETVTVTVEKDNFKTYDSYGYKTYILEEGDYYLAVGTCAHDALNNILAAKGKTAADGMDADGNAEFASLVGEDITLDTTTYAVSAETGNEITNQLDFADMNTYEGSGENEVTYVSRSDWTGTWPEEAVTFSASDEIMLADLASNKEIVEDEDAEMPTYGADNGFSLIMLRSTDEEEISYDDERWDTLLDQMTYEEQSILVTNAVYGTSGISSIGLPATTANDGPTGVVSSNENLSFPSEGIWASTFNLDLIAKIGDALAEDARDAGCEGMYLPGVNIHRTAFGGRAHEYFSEDPYLSGVAAEAEIVAVQNKGVIPYVKHMAFNDEEDNRNGICIWLNEQSAREIYLKPFEYAVSPSKGNAHAVMSGFNRVGCLWVSASDALINGILRDEFGFDGIVLTDMASGNGALYMVYDDGYMNGTDLFLGTGSEDALAEYKTSATFANQIREACHRILYVMANYSSSMNGVSSTSEIVRVATWWETLLRVLIAVCAALTLGAAAAMAVDYGKRRKKEANN
ncbi:MAG: glycoside hydrolase family 3 C-terminal domain-containing protein [Lachnospiraceae bacterium]|nr:glycoside hydrolase family 3 C-terminal domain-containing protein [Lachnospiraceae bacterium]